MLEHMTGPEVAAAAKMMRTSFCGTILIVEGPSDYCFLEELIEKGACERLTAHGKENALEAISILREQGALAGTLAFVDADFDRISNDVPQDDAIVVSDHHDAEMMMLFSPAAEKIVLELGSSDKIPKFVANRGCSSAVELVFREAAKIGHVRLASKQNGWNLNFQGLKYKKFTDKMIVDENKLARVILANSGASPVTADEVRAVVPKQSPHCHGEICCGHDCTSLLALGLRNCFGSQPPQLAKRENIEKFLRIGYEHAYWITSQTHSSFVGWEGRNAPYKVVRTILGPDS